MNNMEKNKSTLEDALSSKADEIAREGTSKPKKQSKKKNKRTGRTIIFIICLILVIIVVAAAAYIAGAGGIKNVGEKVYNISQGLENKDSKGDDQASEERKDDGTIYFEGNGYTIKFLKATMGKDYEGNPCLYFYYTYTNKENENGGAYVDSYIKCFQDGIQCETAFTDNVNDEMENYLKEVKIGASLACCQAFTLQNSESDVTIEASDLISLSDEKATQVIKLK